MNSPNHFSRERDLNPLHFRRQLNDSLARFIAAAASVSQSRAPRLRSKVIEQISKEVLVKGPFVESLPDFDKGMSLRDMASAGRLHSDWNKMSQHAADLWERPLHAHQCLAMEQSENYIVATGTGSGKTEAFLFPMIEDLLSGSFRDEPGVKAILIYPLNALATDQMHRIARLLFRDMDDPDITLGLYTGQVQSSDDRPTLESTIQGMPAFRENFGEDSPVPQNWLLSRDEMLQDPPDILITNYAMLEHILLLPRNRGLLNKAIVKWLVLDELHSYTGATAIEVAFLIRKLKANLGIDRGHMRCVGTSASLDPARKADLVNFAEKLFDEPFPYARDSVISAERKIHPALSTPVEENVLSADSWISLGDTLSELRSKGVFGMEEAKYQVQHWNASTNILTLDGPHFGEALINALSRSKEVRNAARFLSSRIYHVGALATAIFPDEDSEKANRATHALISLGVMAKSYVSNTYPLLPARYHIAASAIPGLIITLTKNDNEHWASLDVSAQGRMATEEREAAWSLWVCRNCGEPYIECYDDRRSMNPIPSRRKKKSGDRVLLRLAGNGALALEDDDEEQLSASTGKSVTIDPKTGKILEDGDQAGLTLEVANMHHADDNPRKLMKRCLCCGDTGGISHEPVTRIHPGDEMMASYISSLLIEEMPASNYEDSSKPIDGRHILTFSDNRQDAAFFAPYIERISRVESLRGAILSCLESVENPIDIHELCNDVWSRLAKHNFVLYSHSLHTPLKPGLAKDRLLSLIVAEATMGGLRQSMESYGLMSISYDGFENALEGVKHELSDDYLKKISYPTLMFILTTMRQGRAINSMNRKLDLSDDSIWGEALADTRINWVLVKSGTASRTRAILPKHDSIHTRATWILEERLGIEKSQAREFLKSLWNTLSRRSVGLLEKNGNGKVLAVEKWEFNRSDGTLHICNTCARVSTFDFEGVCAAWRCEGKTKPISSNEIHESEKSHYINRYRENPPSVIAREHTAALSTEDRNRIEDRFREGHINLLSCTTTMEMGVDLGDLEAVVCRNVPPGISNYQQRSGRAGRRAQVAPIALTIARQNRYDQVKFDEFDEYLESLPAMPYLSLANLAFLRRHQVSCILSGWIAKRIGTTSRTGAPNLEHVLGKKLDNFSIHDIRSELEEWLKSDEGIERIIIAEKMTQGLEFRVSRADLADLAKREIGRWIVEVADRWQIMDNAITVSRKAIASDDCSDEDIKYHNKRIDALGKNKDRYMRQNVTTMLSQRAVIPTYSFPIHSLHLEIVTQKDPKNRSRTGPDLNRDAALAIAEYAPGAEVVAAGRIWRSAGIARRHIYATDQTSYIDRGSYRICRNCRHPETIGESEKFEPKCSHCGKEARAEIRHFQVPIGFLTSYRESDGRDPGTSRIRSRYVDEARLITKALPTHYKDTNIKGIRTFFAPAHIRPDNDVDFVGRMMVVNRGPRTYGYLTCNYCEHSQPAEKFRQSKEDIPHADPRTGRDCTNVDLNRPEDLVHIYQTDIRGFHISHEMPSIDEATEEDQDFIRTCLLRTVGEAFRLAAASLLEADPRDLRASIEISFDDAPLIILSDTTPGGAGYVSRLIQESQFSAKNLLVEALKILDCPRNKKCETSCSKCLNDYSNQQFWDEFDRHLASGWLRDLLDKVVSPPESVPLDCAPVSNFSPRIMSIHLKGANSLVIVGTSLSGSGGNEVKEEEAIESARTIRDWLEGDSKRKVSFVVPKSKALRFGKNQTTTDKTVTDILLSVKGGAQLKFFHIPDSKVVKAPRVSISSCYGTDEHTQEWYCSDKKSAVFSAATTGTSFHRVSTCSWFGKVKDTISKINSPLDIQENATHVYRFSAGEKRDFESIFSTVMPGTYDVTISDPYLASSKKNRNKFHLFISEMQKVGIELKRLKVQWKPQVGYENVDIESQIEDIRSKIAPICNHIDFNPWDGKVHFHDRRVILFDHKLDTNIQIDLTSGVDNLMSVNRECSVFVEHQDKFKQ